MFLCSLTPVPCAFHLPWQMPIYFDIVLSVGGCGVNFFSWSTFPSMSGDRNWPLLLIEAVFHCGTTLKRLWILWMHALSWAIWREHNNRLFENRIGDFSSVWDSFCFFFLLACWVKKDCMFSSFCFDSLCCNLRSFLLSLEKDLSFGI